MSKFRVDKIQNMTEGNIVEFSVDVINVIR